MAEQLSSNGEAPEMGHNLKETFASSRSGCR